LPISLAAARLRPKSASARRCLHGQRVVTASDEERKRVARDVHDGAQQPLVVSTMLLRQALQALDEGDPNIRELVEEAVAHAERANSELRELVRGVLPRVLIHGGLRPAINSLVSPIDLPVTVDVTQERFASRIESTAYFVVSEALTNVVKHAGAKSAAITARVHRGELILEGRTMASAVRCKRATV
jgi:signal transduction histidine kinase